MRRPRILLAAVLATSLGSLTAVAAPGCLLTSFEYDPLAPEAGPDAEADAKEAGPPACGKTYPDPPTTVDDPLDDHFVLALRSIDLGEGQTSPPGYDLDHQCTCINGVGPSCVSSQSHCDAPEGVDNASAQLMSLLQLGLGSSNFGSSHFSNQADKGLWSFLIEVRGYNNTPDDPDVTVAVYPSPGLGGKMPLWDGSDAWQVTASSVMNGDVTKPVYTSKGAYVTKNVLVAALPSVELTIAGASERISLKVTGGVLTGTISGPPGHRMLADGILAARWQEHDIFAALSSYRSAMGKPICTDLGIPYDTAKSAICGGFDILADATGAKSLPCDSLSIGIGFRAETATLGMPAAPPAPGESCPMTTDPINDKCTP